MTISQGIQMVHAETHVELLAREIVARMQHTEPGHCARVDFLDLTEVLAICRYIAQHQLAEGIVFHILASNVAQSANDPLFITTDKVIEIRNRKQARLCLFVPANLVDAAYSSISNSFALIDGRTLHTLLVKRVQALLSPELSVIVRAVFVRLRGLAGVSEEQRLDFVLALLRHMQAGETTGLGLELWRIGLIADASDAFVTRLESNRDCTLSLSRPSKLGATTRERIQSLKVDVVTATRLGQFFRGHALNDVRTWSRALAQTEQGLTFERWVFPKADRSDIHSVSVVPFVNAKGEVERSCHLHQPYGAGSGLLARYGAKETITVRWKTDPEVPSDLSHWRVGIVPSGSDNGFEGCLDERNVTGTRRMITIKLDMEFDEQPDYAVCIRIAPLNADGSEILKNDEAIFADSHEFFLVKDGDGPQPDPPKKSLQMVPTLAFGRLDFVVNMREGRDAGLTETEPEWISKGLEYFRVRLNEQRVMNIGLSGLLLELEKRVLAEPQKGGCFLLDIDEVKPVGKERFTAYPLLGEQSQSWSVFWRIREIFFKRLRQAEVRSVIEAADWTPDLAIAALRYAQVYRELLDDLIAHRVAVSELREALSIDMLLVRNTGAGEQLEEAMVILPTHPLRVAWYASYTQLLRTWEKHLLGRPPRERKLSIDLHVLRSLVPTNVPAFTYHPASADAFTFFQNLRFFYGVALPAGVPDPHRRYGDIATILDTGVDQVGIGDVQPDQLAEHLACFCTLHLYAETLVTTLINPDRGNFFAEAMRKFLALRTAADDSEKAEQVRHAPAFQIISYAEDTHKSTLQALEQVRQQQIDLQHGKSSDHFLPGLTTTAREMSQLERSAPPQAHIAVVTDFTRPSIIPSLPAMEVASNDTSSFSLYGLINRFISQFTADEQGLFWRHRIITEGVRKPEPHPATAKLSEMLIDLHTSLLNAGGYILGGPAGTRPVLEVRLEAARRDLLERLHANTNWVITLDRFFTLDYYDSPHQPGLDEVARKYVLDYSPEFTEGLGHRMMVTTAWHEEIGSLLSQAMDELGFASIDESVGRLLHHLKTISGRLALDALESSTSAAAAVGLGVVTAWLQKNKKLRQAVLLPVDIYPRIFSRDGTGKSAQGERRCDLVLISLKRNIVDATFIEVKWRRGRTPFEELAKDMVLQMEGSAQGMRSRFFSESRVDGALQRSYFANVLRFYFERSRRYKLFDPEAEAAFLEHVTRLEKTGLDFRASYEGYIVSLDSEPRKALLLDNAKVIVLTAKDFESDGELSSFITPSISGKSVVEQPLEEQLHDQGQIIPHVHEEEQDRTMARPRKATVVPNSSNEQGAEEAHNSHAMSEVVIPLGEALGERVNWNPGVKGSPHLFMLGIPGQGKSWTVTRILSELGRQQVPALVLDFHGQFADTESTFVKAMRPTVLDAAKGLPFSPFECTRENGQGGWMANALAVAEIFAYVAGLGEIQKDIIYTSVRDAYKVRGFGDEGEEASGHALEYPTLQEVMNLIEHNEQSRHVANVAARCRPLLEMNLFRPQETPADFLTLIRSGLVIDLHDLFAETLQIATGAFVLRKLYKDMFRWGYAKRLRLAIVLDEAHRLAKDISLPKLMKEGRKFGISVIVASQGLGDFHQDVLSNAGTKVIFRMNYPESRKVSGFMRGRPGQDLAERIEQLPVGSAYVQTPEMMYSSTVNMYPLED